MKRKEFFTTGELAKILGISRIAVFKKIKTGEIEAQKIGRIYVIEKKELGKILGDVLSPDQKKVLDRAISKTLKDYGKTLEMLGSE